MLQACSIWELSLLLAFLVGSRFIIILQLFTPEISVSDDMDIAAIWHGNLQQVYTPALELSGPFSVDVFPTPLCLGNEERAAARTP